MGSIVLYIVLFSRRCHSFVFRRIALSSFCPSHCVVMILFPRQARWGLTFFGEFLPRWGWVTQSIHMITLQIKGARINGEVLGEFHSVFFGFDWWWWWRLDCWCSDWRSYPLRRNSDRSLRSFRSGVLSFFLPCRCPCTRWQQLVIN